MTRMVERLGRTGFAALASLAWALPMAAWAGSADLSPIDQTAYPWIALTIGVAMLIAWLVLVARLRKIPVTARPHRLDLQQMSTKEKRWMLVFAAFVTGIIAWLNTAATVDWSPLTIAITKLQPKPTIFAIAAAALLIALLAGAAISWRRATQEFEARRTRPKTVRCGS